MMYKLRFQKCGPYHWRGINTIIGDIGSVQTARQALILSAANEKTPWGKKIATEVSALNDRGSFEPVYASGAFHEPGSEVDLTAEPGFDCKRRD